MSSYKIMGNFVYWDVPSAIERLALVPSPSEIYKVCLQRDTYSFFVLVNVTTLEWVEIESMSTALTLRYDVDSPTKSYLGHATVGSAESASVWRIQELQTPVGGDVEIRFADGNSNFDNIWADRAALSYS